MQAVWWRNRPQQRRRCEPGRTRHQTGCTHHDHATPGRAARHGHGWQRCLRSNVATLFLLQLQLEEIIETGAQFQLILHLLWSGVVLGTQETLILLISARIDPKRKHVHRTHVVYATHGWVSEPCCPGEGQAATCGREFALWWKYCKAEDQGECS